jgi:uncharacterized protein
MIFLDTSFYIALVNPKDKYYLRAIELLNDIKNGLYGTTYTSNYVMAESAILTAIRTKKHQTAINAIRSFFIGEAVIAKLVRSTDELDKRAWDLFCKINIPTLDQPLSFIDCSSVVISQHYHIGMIISFDTHFESWFKQIV